MRRTAAMFSAFFKPKRRCPGDEFASRFRKWYSDFNVEEKNEQRMVA